MAERVCALITHTYEADIGRLMQRRAAQAGRSLCRAQHDCAQMRIVDEADMRAWLSCTAALLLRDLAHLELAARVEMLTLPLRDKQLALSEALRLSRELEGSDVREGLAAHFATQDSLNLEGFVRFRMPRTRQAWDACVAQAAEELLLEREYKELIGVLSAFAQLQPPRMKNIYLILNPDGSCTLSDDMQSRIKYEDGTGDGVVSVLIGLAPERITVYDLSGGRGAALANVLIRVFEDRVKYFK